MGSDEHKRAAPPAAEMGIAVVTVSDTRTFATDESGRIARELAAAAGLAVRHGSIVRDEPADIAREIGALAQAGVEVVVVTGGTGISRRDSTVEAVERLFHKRLDGFGELFRMLSFQEIGSAAMLSRAVAGTIGAVAVFVMPGSPGAVRLAMERLILPELGHIVAQLRRDTPRAASRDDRREHGDHHA